MHVIDLIPMMRLMKSIPGIGLLRTFVECLIDKILNMFLIQWYEHFRRCMWNGVYSRRYGASVGSKAMDYQLYGRDETLHVLALGVPRSWQ